VAGAAGQAAGSLIGKNKTACDVAKVAGTMAAASALIPGIGTAFAIGAGLVAATAAGVAAGTC